MWRITCRWRHQFRCSWWLFSYFYTLYSQLSNLLSPCVCACVYAVYTYTFVNMPSCAAADVRFFEDKYVYAPLASYKHNTSDKLTWNFSDWQHELYSPSVLWLVNCYLFPPWLLLMPPVCVCLWFSNNYLTSGCVRFATFINTLYMCVSCVSPHGSATNYLNS